ncbi:MAG: YggT family protein, partial [Plesiomonas shigelloides]
AFWSLGYILLGVLATLKAAGKMIFWVLLIRALLSWVSQGRSPMDYVLYQLTEPMLAPLRRILPPMGGLDLSVMLLSIILIALNYLGADLFGFMWMQL